MNDDWNPARLHDRADELGFLLTWDYVLNIFDKARRGKEAALVRLERPKHIHSGDRRILGAFGKSLLGY
jgi:hypothetical protein